MKKYANYLNTLLQQQANKIAELNEKIEKLESEIKFYRPYYDGYTGSNVPRGAYRALFVDAAGASVVVSCDSGTQSGGRTYSGLPGCRLTHWWRMPALSEAERKREKERYDSWNA